MKKIFAIADTHRLMVIPPTGYDLTIHLGDFIDYFDIGPAGEKAALYHRRFDQIREAYTHIVLGNHERMFLHRFGKGIITGEIPESLTVQVEGIKLRLAHYLYLPRPEAREYPPVPESLLENLYKEVIRHDARLVLYGHTHHQRHDVYQGFHLVDTGFGEVGAAAEIIVDGKDVEVKLLPGLREREEEA